MMSKEETDKSYIEQYKIQNGIDGAKVATLFFEKGVAEYLMDNFEVLHTQSRQWLMEEIDNYLKNNRAS